MARRAPQTVQEHCIARLGLMKGTRCATFIACWAIACEDLGEGRRYELGQGEGLVPALREYAEYWKDSERTAYRRLKEFRSVFAYETPQPIVDEMFAAKREAAAAQAFPLAALALA